MINAIAKSGGNSYDFKIPVEAIEKMKKALDKLKPQLMGESVDAMTIIVEGEKKKRDKSISKSTQPYGAKEGGVVDTTKFRYI